MRRCTSIFTHKSIQILLMTKQFKLKATARHLANMPDYGIVHHPERCYFNGWKDITTKEKAAVFTEWPTCVSRECWEEEGYVE